MIGLDFENHLK